MADFIIISLGSYSLVQGKEKRLEQGLLFIIARYIVELLIVVEMSGKGIA